LATTANATPKVAGFQALPELLSASAARCLCFSLISSSVRKLFDVSGAYIYRGQALTFCSCGRVSLVNPLVKNQSVDRVGSEKMSIVQILSEPELLADDEWTAEAIDRRANYVGPVLEGIMRDMEAHWRQNRDVEL
jgi:hypothetical protein